MYGEKASMYGRKLIMFRKVSKSKIHRATITDANLHYEGSLTVDPLLMHAADIIPNEIVQVVNINNGERFETYVIEGKKGAGEICLNGAAARRGQPGDLVIIITYGYIDQQEVGKFSTTVVKVDKHNKII